MNYDIIILLGGDRIINFIKVFSIILIKQVIFLAIFSFSVSTNSDGIFFIPVLLLVIYLLFYFKYSKDISKKIFLDRKTFDLYYFLSFIIIGFIITFLIFTDSWLWDILPTASGIFAGIEYILVPMLLGIYLIVLCAIRFSIYIFRR